MGNFHAVQGQAGILADDRGSGQRCNILEQGLAPVAETGGFDGNAADGAAQLVHHQGRQSLALHILGDDRQGPAAGLGNLFQSRHNVVDRADLAVGNQQQRLLEGHFHPLGVGYEVGGQIAPVEAHSLGNVHFVGHTLGFLNGDDPFPAHLVHGLGNQLGDAFLVGRQGGDPGHLFPIFHGDGHSDQFVHHGGHGAVNARFQAHPVGPGGDVHKALPHHSAGQHYRGSGAVAHHIVGFGGRLLDQLRPHIFIDVGQFHLFGDGDAVAAHHRQGPHPIEQHIAAAGPQGQPDHPAQFIHAPHQAGPGLFVKKQLLVRHTFRAPPTFALRRRFLAAALFRFGNRRPALDGNGGGSAIFHRPK